MFYFWKVGIIRGDGPFDSEFKQFPYSLIFGILDSGLFLENLFWKCQGAFKFWVLSFVGLQLAKAIYFWFDGTRGGGGEGDILALKWIVRKFRGVKKHEMLEIYFI